MNNHQIKSAFDKIFADEALKERTYRQVMSKKNNQLSHKPVLLLAVISICFLVFMIPSFKQTETIDRTEYSYITIDVNPSIEFVLNKEDIVIFAKAYNPEGSQVLEELTYENENYQTVISNLLKSPLYKTYLENNTDIQVSICSLDNQKSRELENCLDELMTEVRTSHHYESICVDQKVHHEADNHHVSCGKYVLIQDIIACESSYTLSDLQTKSVSELRDIYQTLTNQEYNYNATHHHHNNHH